MPMIVRVQGWVVCWWCGGAPALVLEKVALEKVVLEKVALEKVALEKVVNFEIPTTIDQTQTLLPTRSPSPS